jgi:3-methyladenine DNA glycosylase AlkD
MKTPRRTPAQRTKAQAGHVDDQLRDTMAWLEKSGTRKTRDGMARYAIPSDTAFGVTVGELKRKAKELGTSHELAAALWETNRYEARMLASFIDDPARVTPAQMDRWCRDFDNWAICDTVCFHLFDRTPHAWGKVEQWAVNRDEFVKRAAFALLWGLTGHDKTATDAQFTKGLNLIETAASDDRNFVKKAASMALRAIGRRRGLRASAIAVSSRLAASEHPGARWVGKDALRELSKR